MKANGAIDRAGAVASLKPLQKADPELYQKVLKIFVTCGMRGNVSNLQQQKIFTKISVKPVADPCETATILAVCAKQEAEAVSIFSRIVKLKKINILQAGLDDSLLA